MATARVKEILSWYGSDNPGVKANLARLMNTGRLAGTGKFVILPVDFTEATGELTPTMKVKRNVVAEKFADAIEAIYRKD